MEMTAISSTGYLSPSAFNVQNHLCVLPCGGLPQEDLRDWKKEDLAPCVSYMLNGQGIDRMFGGFIFNGIRTRSNHFMFPLYVGFGQPANQTDWTDWIHSLFAREQNLEALASLAQHPLDIWISIPYPHPFQEKFGIVKGKMINFKMDDHRFLAVTWWIDQLIHRWKKAAHLHEKLILRGFLWQREAVDGSDEKLVKQTNEYIKAKGFLSIWLPNYGSYGVMDFQKLGFDITAINSNYYGNTTHGVEWITHASNFSKVCHTGLQITFGKGIIYNETHFLDYLNLGLPEKNGYMTECFLVYQFPNQSVREIYENRFVDYIRLYTFIKGLYTKVTYPGIPY